MKSNWEKYRKYYHQLTKNPCTWYNQLSILKLSHKEGNTIAYRQAEFGWKTENIELLKLVGPHGRTIAHLQAERGWSTNNPEILKLNDRYLKSVAYTQIRNGWIPKDKKTLEVQLAYQNTIAHLLATHTDWITDDYHILALKNSYNGHSVAYTLIKKGHIFTEYNILNIKNNDGKSNGHFQASNGWITKDEQILQIVDNNHLSIAHILASKGIPPINNKIGNLTNKSGDTVNKKYAIYLIKHQRGKLTLKQIEEHISSIYKFIPHFRYKEPKKIYKEIRKQLI